MRNAYRLDRDWRDPANRPVVSTPLKVFQCPSAPNPGRVFDVNGGPFGTIQVGSGSYAPLNAVQTPLMTQGVVDNTPGDARLGVLRNGLMRRVVEITDGASNTLVLAEDAGRPERYEKGRGLVANSAPSGAAWADRESPYDLHGSFFNATTGRWQDGSATTPGTCPINCHNGNEVFAFHPGGAHILMADGAARFVREGLDIRIFARLITRAGGEVVPGDAY